MLTDWVGPGGLGPGHAVGRGELQWAGLGAVRSTWDRVYLRPLVCGWTRELGARGARPRDTRLGVSTLVESWPGLPRKQSLKQLVPAPHLISAAQPGAEREGGRKRDVRRGELAAGALQSRMPKNK